MNQSGKTKLLWFDATANLERLSSAEKVAVILDKCASAGITGVVVGVKTPCGFALHNSQVLPRMKTFMGKVEYPDGYDLLRSVTDAARVRGLKVYALMMVFSEGRLADKSGPAYSVFPEWQSIYYDVGVKGWPDLIRSEESTKGVFVFVNPAHPDAQEYELRAIREVASQYDIDGVVIDRCRYDGIRADFSPLSKTEFSKWLGDPVDQWPDDVLVLEATPAHPEEEEHPGITYELEEGPLYKPWLEWRAGVLGDFVRRAADAVRGVRSGMEFGSVVGCWYPEYFAEGANWASSKFDTSARYPWATPNFSRTGYAESLSFLTPNCYSKAVWLTDLAAGSGAPWNTVQGGAQIAREVVMGACPIYAGVYVEEYRDRPERLREAIRAALQESDGVKIFDLSQVDGYDLWDLVGEELRAG